VDLSGIELFVATGTSADGSVVVGNMYRNGFQEGYVARVGGLITAEGVARSFSAASGPAAGLAGTVQDAARQADCRQFGHAGLCAFSDLILGANSDDGSLTGTTGIAARLGAGRVGVFGGYSAGSFDLAFGGSAHGTAPVVGVFAGWGAPEAPGFNAVASVAYGQFAATINRGYVNGAGLAISPGDTEIAVLAGSAHIGVGLAVAPGAVISPFAGIEASRAGQHAYIEQTGPFPARFDRRSDSTSSVRIGIAGDFAAGPIVSVHGSAAWGHRIADHADDVTGSIETVLELATAAASRAEDWAEAELAVGLQVAEQSRVLAGISGRFGTAGEAQLAGNVGVYVGF
jgi:outer membrane autotransporter protein